MTDDPTYADAASEDQMPPDQRLEHVHLVASKPVWAAIFVLGTIIASGFTAWLRHVDAAQDVLAQKVEAQQAQNAGAAERMMRVETKIESIEKSQGQMADGIRDISQKLDRLMERGQR
jgi:hypothetical protein